MATATVILSLSLVYGLVVLLGGSGFYSSLGCLWGFVASLLSGCYVSFVLGLSHLSLPSRDCQPTSLKQARGTERCGCII